MDSLNYYYFAGTNRLRGVMDNQITEPYENDINFMSTIDIYSYNERGDMIQDNMEKIYVDWLVNGKIKGVRRFATVADLPDLEFKYDAMGNRISKLVKTRTGTDIDYENEWQKTYYVRDAQGNVLATYDRTWQGFTTPGYTASDQLKITEQHLYGSSRVGVNRANKITASRNYTVGAYGANGITVQYNYASGIDYTAPNPVRTRYETGRRNYELTNHLGNVLAVVTDNVLARIENPPAPGVLRFVPHIVQANDYYPFGMIMPGRSVNSGGYRYGFNGMLRDDEIAGQGNSYTAEFWQYDSRLGRRWNTDPVVKPWESSYLTFSGNPILNIDPNGDNANPAYDTDGNFLGNTESGFTGEALVFNDPSKFSEGMKDSDAMKSSTTFDKSSSLSSLAKSNILSHIVNYSSNDGLSPDSKINIDFTGSDDYMFSARDATKENVKILAGSYQKYFETTVENIRNAINLHEVDGHVKGGISGWPKDHYKAQMLQINHASFLKTTPKFQGYNMALFYKLSMDAGIDITKDKNFKGKFYDMGGYDQYMYY